MCGVCLGLGRYEDAVKKNKRKIWRRPKWRWGRAIARNVADAGAAGG